MKSQSLLIFLQLNLKAMYESNIFGTTSKKKVNGHQSIFEEFLDASRTFHKPNVDDGSINANYGSPAVAKFWNNIAPIINFMSGKMNQSL